ncbi:HNH endonuclease [Streptomyces sp. A 4/2]|uniref:HNH endonuclease n=1 Tax=Streptomyces sp. A 4/2 TaxID=2934314 RepID=UPI0020256970|nr:HNH endonuclease [Streptomyces sp. A 4/2]
MIPLDPPAMKVKDTLTAACGRMQNSVLRLRLLAREKDLSAAEKTYTDAAEHNALYALAVTARDAEEQIPDRDGEHLRNLYSAGLVGRKHGREKYDELKARAPFGRCLLCGNSEIGSLDHHLPKDTLPLFTICPVNLVPACSKCNQAKGDRIGATASQRTLHPYYDRPGQAGRYLFADITSWPVQFRIQALPVWDAELRARVEHHFVTFNLAQRYAEFCISVLTANQWLHQKIRRESGLSALTAHLQEDAEQHASTHGLNTWDTALRYGLADSNWYLHHGVNQNP